LFTYRLKGHRPFFIRKLKKIIYGIFTLVK
jgi:hypothetical protein